MFLYSLQVLPCLFISGTTTIITIYAPIIFTAPCEMFVMRADTLRGQVGGGWALEMETFLGPVKWHRADRRVPFGATSPVGCLLHIIIYEEAVSHMTLQPIPSEFSYI
jgi:hypothetical protein